MLLNPYAHSKELFLKARFILICTVFLILFQLAGSIYNYMVDGMGPILFTGAAGIIIYMISLAVLAKGRYNEAIHITLATCFSTIWIIIFIKPDSSMIAKMDTLVYIVAILAIMPIVFFRTRKTSITYFLINGLIFLVFNYTLMESGKLSSSDHLDYFFDISVTMVMVFVVSYNLFGIYRQIISSLNSELIRRKKTEKALSDSRYQLAEHLKSTPVGAIFWDMRFKVTEWNPAAEKIFGYTKDEAMGKELGELILAGDQKEMVGNIMENLLSGCGGERSINENITKSGKRILCDWYNSVLKNTDGKKIGGTSLVNDITEKTKIQEMMIQSEKMLSVGGLAAGMAHEVNNPLAGMIQNAQVAHNRLAQALPANEKAAGELGVPISAIQGYATKRQVLKALENIMEAGRHATKIIQNMLSFSRKSDSKRKEALIESLLDSTIQLAKNDNGNGKRYNFGMIKIVREYCPSLPAIFCEKSKIQQVLFNIFKNACDSMNTKTYTGEIPPTLILRLKKEADYIHIEIEDNGAGMDSDTCKRIFEPFFTTKDDKGTGLGLSISYHIIVDDHGGIMKVRSIPGEGSTFIIGLPYRKVPERSGDETG